ncbi:AraC family transcriptional regulator [Pleionea sp. CnH1-48]|uniref:AraC family transcriptional regulator n=1 Tax=Pleionea sp. CnH1-48 TaxID=2954494 RepID=UPI002096DEC6|nr:AraC family transcriptional regulator [Pleionea sp. CnH1-48]MCO7223072.1 AraC family transcriptional regulator [Pleionea sp. CnH1-48]
MKALQINMKWVLNFCYAATAFMSANALALQPADGENTDQEEAVEQVEEVIDDTSVAESLEDLKKKVLSVNRELFILEEDLLFPASTQTAFFVSLDVGYFFKLDSVKLKVDGEVVTQYLYTDRELDALRRGAVQRLHLENVTTGEHDVVVLMIGYGPENREYKIAVEGKFEKDTEAKLLEIQIRDDSNKQQPKLVIKEWN